MEIIFRGDKLPIIKTRRLILRDITVADISQDYIDWLNNPKVNEFLEIRFSKQTRETVTAYIQAKLADTRNSKHFGIYDQDGSRLIGTVTFPVINWHHLFADLSFVIGHPEGSGHGYATEAVNAALYYIFNFCDMYYVWAGYYEGHNGSSSVLKKNGFKVEGCFRKKRINAQGVRVDNILTGLQKDEYKPKPDLLGVLPPTVTEMED